MKKFRHWLEYLLLRFIAGVFCILPEKIALSFAKSLGTFIYYCIPIRKKIVIRNIAQAFPGKDIEFYKRIALSVYQHFMISCAEFSRMKKISKEDIQSKIINFEESQKVLNGFRELITISGHIGNWELMGAFGTMSKHPVAVVAKPMHNPYVDRYINEIRAEKGYEVIETRTTAKKIITKLRAGVMLGFVADQDARKNGIFVDFFGKPASTYKGPALFSTKLNIPLVPLFCLYVGMGKYKILFKEPLYPPSEISDKEKAIEELTQKYVAVLEEVIREYPEQYFWFHRRWKTKQ